MNQEVVAGRRYENGKEVTEMKAQYLESEVKELSERLI